MTADVVIPTTRPDRLAALLARLEWPSERVIVVDGRGRSPAAARNAGWRRTRAEWVAFLDDDVLPAPDWPRLLVKDLRRAAWDVAGVQGRVEVPLPVDRRPTDWERSVAGLAEARWATADMAYRRDVLEELGGFDEGFPRPYREDADLALRALRAGYRLEQGLRTVVHPVGSERPWASLGRQAGNADDARMRAKHGAGWRREIGAPRGRLRRHLAVVAAGVAAPVLASRSRRAGAALGAAWLAGTGELALARSLPGPRTRLPRRPPSPGA